MAIGTLLGLAAGAQALGSVAQGAGTIAQARQAFSAEDRKRLEELAGRRLAEIVLLKASLEDVSNATLDLVGGVLGAVVGGVLVGMVLEAIHEVTR